MSSQVQPIGTFPSAFRLVSPVVAIDASGGAVEVDGNAKFNTNLPLDRYALITKVWWVMSNLKLPRFDSLATAQQVTWGAFAQLTEALARTAPVTTDPVFVDQFAYQWSAIKDFTTSGEAFVTDNRIQFFQQVLANPWATAAQTLNLVCSAKILGGNNTNGPSITIAAIIEYQSLSLTPAIQAYLATRVQIAGQA